MVERIKKGLEGKFSDAEIAQIESFLDRGFSLAGQIAVASIFLFAKESQKSVADVLKACETEWERNWQHQQPDIKGNPDVPGGAGNQNRVSLNNIYRALGVPSPLDAKEIEVPRKPFKAKTAHSTYVFGQADDKGERTIAREEKPLEFARCMVNFLAIGKGMQLEALDDPKGKTTWRTSAVLSIEETT